MDKMKVKYDPLLFKLPKGPVVKNTKTGFYLQVADCVVPDKVLFMCREDADADFSYTEMEKTTGGYVLTKTFEKSGHYWYCFKIVFCDNEQYVCKTYDCRSYVSEHIGDFFFQSVLEKEYTCSDSMQGGIIYQIFVDRFCKSGASPIRESLIMREDWGGKIQKNTTDPLVINQEVFGGNFKGVESKLDYLEKLGVTTIYLNPIGMANSNHKYDTADYMRVDPMFGKESDFKRLIDKAKEKNIQIIFDGVYNHTGSDSIYFNKYGRFDTLGAYKSEKSRYFKWFDFVNYPDEYASWWGIDTLPSVKDNNEDFQNYIAGENGVLDKFMKLGVAGVRLDVVDEITDTFVKKISNRVHAYGDNKVVMGEVWEDAATKISYSARRRYFADGELNSVMNYPIKETILSYVKTGNPDAFVSTCRMLENNYPKTVQNNLMNFLGTHDTGRVFSEILGSVEGDRAKATQLMKIASALLFTVSGVPSIFYGDEYGMENNDHSSRGCFDWKNYKNEIFDWYTKLTKIRKLECLKDSETNILFAKDGKLVFERAGKKERIVVLVNLGASPLDVNLEGHYTSFVSGKKANNFKLCNMQFEILVEKKK